jgi:hypothetical protein
VVAWLSSTERTMTASTIEKHTPGPTKHSLHQTTGTLAGKRTPRLLLRVRLTSVDVIRAVFHRPAHAHSLRGRRQRFAHAAGGVHPLHFP